MAQHQNEAKPAVRLVVFAHYSRVGTLQRHVQQHLEALRPLATHLVFVSTSSLNHDDRTYLRQRVDAVLEVPNEGYDFAMWASVLLSESLDSYDEVLLTNSSVIGPVRNTLQSCFAKMAGDPCDFWGITESHQHDRHLQSYFLLFRSSVLHSKKFLEFWRTVLPFRNKWQVIRSYEIGLTQYFTEQGFRAGAVVPWSSFGLKSLIPASPPIQYPLAVLDKGSPYVKMELVRDHRLHVSRRKILRELATYGYGAEDIG